MAIQHLSLRKSYRWQVSAGRRLRGVANRHPLVVLIQQNIEPTAWAMMTCSIVHKAPAGAASASQSARPRRGYHRPFMGGE